MNIRQNKGITLVALVITIIVLLILAGVTISLLIGDNGIINHAKTSGIEYTKSQIKEEMQLAILDLETELLNKKPSEDLTKQAIIDNLADKLDNTFTITNVLDGEYKGYNYYIDDEHVVHIGDKANGIMTLDAKIKKIGTAYFTISANATSTAGNIVGYIYIIDGVEKPQTTENIYTEQNLVEKTHHTAKVIAVDEKQNRRESRLFKITTEEKVYLYKDGVYNPLIANVQDGGHYGKNAGSVTQNADNFTVYSNAQSNAHYGRSQNLINFSEYNKLCGEFECVYGGTGTPSWIAVFLSTASSYAGVDNHLGNLGISTGFKRGTGREKLELDVSNINTSAYIHFRQTHYGRLYIYNLWLEK